MSCLRSLQMLLSCQCVQGLDPQSTQQNEMWQGCWPIWHHSWDTENCWLGRSWADETTDRGCFQLRCDPIRLAGELYSEPIYGQGWSPWLWYLSRSQSHRLSHEAVMGCPCHPWHVLERSELHAGYWSIYHPGAGGAFAWVPHWCNMGASLCWWSGAHRGHPGWVYLQAQAVKGWHGE